MRFTEWQRFWGFPLLRWLLKITRLRAESKSPSKKFSFEPNAITLKKGEPVVLAIHSVDVTHGLQVKELRIKVEIPKKQTVEIPLTPTVVGNFEGRCAHFCGLGHGSMTFMVNVVE